MDNYEINYEEVIFILLMAYIIKFSKNDFLLNNKFVKMIFIKNYLNFIFDKFVIFFIKVFLNFIDKLIMVYVGFLKLKI